MKPKKTCAYSKCHKKFNSKSTKNIYCSKRCSYLAHREKNALLPKECKWCGTPTKNKNKLCSEYCEQAYTHAKEAQKSKTKQDFPSIEEITNLARQAGLSYGQYVGKLYCEQERKK